MSSRRARPSGPLLPLPFLIALGAIAVAAALALWGPGSAQTVPPLPEAGAYPVAEGAVPGLQEAEEALRLAAAEPEPSAPAAPEAQAEPAGEAAPKAPAGGAPRTAPPSASTPLPVQPARYPERVPSSPPLRPAPRRAGLDKTLVLVLDDAGHNLRDLEPFLALPFPLTVAVLPGLPHSREAAERVLAAGKELILHQPMEAEGGQDPGPGAIGPDMGAAEIRRRVAANLDALPGVRGLNNHMGSKATRDPALMTEVLGVAQRRGIYYLDSLTAPDTATRTVADRLDFTTWERAVFLDNSPDRASFIRYVEEGKKKAEKGGPAVMIGHVWSADLAATLMELYPRLVEEGFSLSTISEIMLEEADARPGD